MPPLVNIPQQIPGSDPVRPRHIEARNRPADITARP